MELALTHPTLGYYSRADRLLRHGGDFNTAPALSPFFCQTLARFRAFRGHNADNAVQIV